MNRVTSGALYEAMKRALNREMNAREPQKDRQTE
jgi:hypothetical protein